MTIEELEKEFNKYRKSQSFITNQFLEVNKALEVMIVEQEQRITELENKLRYTKK